MGGVKSDELGAKSNDFISCSVSFWAASSTSEAAAADAADLKRAQSCPCISDTFGTEKRMSVNESAGRVKNVRRRRRRRRERSDGDRFACILKRMTKRCAGGAAGRGAEVGTYRSLAHFHENLVWVSFAHCDTWQLERSWNPWVALLVSSTRPTAEPKLASVLPKPKQLSPTLHKLAAAHALLTRNCQSVDTAGSEEEWGEGERSDEKEEREGRMASRKKRMGG